MPEKDRATTAGNMYENFVKFGHAVVEICKWTDRQTDRQTIGIDTNTLIAILCTLTAVM